MAQVMTAHALGTTEDFGIPGIDGQTAPVLSFDKLTADQSVVLRPHSGASVTSWVLGMDVYIPADSASGFTGLVQTGSGDADLFLRDNGDGTAGLGISGDYPGAIAYDGWNRLVISVTVEDGNTVMRKFANGELIGTQNLGSGSRWAVDAEEGLRLFTDDDGETSPGYVSSLFFLQDPPAAADLAAMVAQAGGPSATGFFPASPAPGAIEVDFADAAVNLRYGEATVRLEGSDTAPDPVIQGDSVIGLASQLGIEGPGGADIPVLMAGGFGPDEHLSVRMPLEVDVLTSFTAVWDINIQSAPAGFLALLQLSADNGDDADLFVNADGGLGISGRYDGQVTFGEWSRIAISVSDNGDGTSTLAKYIDGTLVGEQTVPTARFTLTASQDILLLTDNDGEVGSSGLAHFGLMPRAMTAEEIAELGGVDADGPFTAAPPLTDPGAPAPIRLAHGDWLDVGGAFAAEAVRTEGLTFETEFTFRIIENGFTADGFAFQLQSPQADGSLILGEAGGALGVPAGSSPTIAVVFDTYLNEGVDAAANQIRVMVGNDAWSEPLVSVDAPFLLANNTENKVWIDYDGTNLRVYVADDAAKPGQPVIDVALDLTSVLGETARAGFSGTYNQLDILDWQIATNDPAGPDGALLTQGGDAIDLLGGATRLEPSQIDPPGPMQIGFDNNAPTPEFGFVDSELTDEATLVNGLKDQLVSLKDSGMTFDLAEVFGPGARDFTVTTSNGEAVSATIADGVMTLEFGGYGLADLVISATGPVGQVMTDEVRFRVAGENAYTIAILPDTQDYTYNANLNQTFVNMTQWLADNAGGKNLSFVTHVGDITPYATAGNFGLAKEAMDILRKAGISFSVTPGNHDIGTGGSADVRDTPAFNDAFSIGYMSEDPAFGGVYAAEPERFDNSFMLWTAPDGTEWISLSLEFGPRDDVLHWADQILTQYADRKATVTTHSYNNFDSRHDPLGSPLEAEGAAYDYGLGRDPAGAWDGEEIWREVISSHANVVFTAGGHIFGDGAQTQVSYNAYGHPVYQFLVNYQNGVALETTGAGDPFRGGNGGNGAIRLVTIDPDNDAIYTETYFTELDTYFDGSRGKEDYDRDGLTGKYAGHQEELFDAKLDRTVVAEADAGDDRLVTADAGADTATVGLSAAGSTDPNSNIVSYTWQAEDGTVIATGREASVDLGAGVHDLTLVIETADGVRSTDEQRVIVKTDKVWLAETFNDGNADGWVSAGGAAAANPVGFRTDAGFGLPQIGDAPTPVLRVAAMTADQGLLVKPQTTGTITEFSLVYDLYVPLEGAKGYTALLQTHTGNRNDAEIFLNRSGDSAGIGISGNYQGNIPFDSWNRITLTFSVEDGAQVLRKYLDGQLIGTQTVDGNVADGTRWAIDSDTGFLLFADEDGETSALYASSVAFTPRVLSAAEVAAMGGVDSDGPLNGETTAGTVQLTFDGALDTANVGQADVSLVDLSTGSKLGQFLIKGSATTGTQTVGAAEGALFDQSNTANNMVVWQDGDWDDQVIEATLRSMDRDTMGIAFRHQDQANQYLLTFDNASNTRQLLRIEDGVTTVLAREAGGYRFNDAFDVKIAVVDGRITVSADGVALFGGAVIDAEPLGSGTVGLYSSNQRSSIFDDIIVRAPETQADAGADLTLIDWDGDGFEFVTLDGALSILPTGGEAVAWAGRGQQAEGLDAVMTAQAGANSFTLTVDDTTDKLRVNVASGDRLIAGDRFDDGDHDGWRIVDTTELGGAADWTVKDGRLVEQSGAYSRELTWTGADAADVWQKGWSPQGDGVYALHKGSYALWDGDTALSDYSIQTLVTAPKGAVGLMLNWQDEDNYYKIEIDARVGYTTLVQVVDGYETNLARGTTTYTPGDEFALKAQILDGRIQAWLDGMELFAQPVGVRDLETGAAGVWSWGAAGASFDDIAIVDLTDPFRVEIHGSGVLTGSAEDELFHIGAGRSNVVTGGAGADVFDFGALLSDGTRQTTRITDYAAGQDALDLGGAEIVKSRVAGGTLTLWVGEDQDQIILNGLTGIDDLTFA